jgi:hypothetical protein
MSDKGEKVTIITGGPHRAGAQVLSQVIRPSRLFGRRRVGTGLRAGGGG